MTLSFTLLQRVLDTSHIYKAVVPDINRDVLRESLFKEYVPQIGLKPGLAYQAHDVKHTVNSVQFTQNISMSDYDDIDELKHSLKELKADIDSDAFLSDGNCLVGCGFNAGADGFCSSHKGTAKSDYQKKHSDRVRDGLRDRVRQIMDFLEDPIPSKIVWEFEWYDEEDEQHLDTITFILQNPVLKPVRIRRKLVLKPVVPKPAKPVVPKPAKTVVPKLVKTIVPKLVKPVLKPSKPLKLKLKKKTPPAEESVAAPPVEESVAAPPVEEPEEPASSTYYGTAPSNSGGKFWKIVVKGSSTVITYGKIDAVGRSTIKTHDSITDAEKYAEKQHTMKQKKGYVFD